MTKKIWILCLMAVFSLGTSAQSIIGKWATDPETNDDGKMAYVFNFKDNKNVEFGVECDMSEEEIILKFDLFVTGTYKRNDNQLSIAFDKKDAIFNLKQMDFVGESEELFKDNPELKKEMNKMIKDAVESQKEELLDALPTEDCTMTIIRLTDTTLKIIDEEDDTVMNFKRVK